MFSLSQDRDESVSGEAGDIEGAVRILAACLFKLSNGTENERGGEIKERNGSKDRLTKNKPQIQEERDYKIKVPTS